MTIQSTNQKVIVSIPVGSTPNFFFPSMPMQVATKVLSDSPGLAE